MAASTLIGKGYVELDTKIKSGALQALNGALTNGINAQAIGQNIGQELSGAIAGSLNAQAIGNDLGRDLGRGFNNGMDSTIGGDNPLDDIADDAGDAGEEAGENFGAKMLGAFAALGVGAAMVNSISDALSMEDGTALLANQLGMTVEESAKYGKMAGEVFSQNYGESQEQVNTAFKDILGNVKGAREMTAEEVGGMAKDMLNMSATFGMESNEIGGAIKSMMDTGIVKTWDEGMDVLFAGLQKGGKPAESLLDIFSQYSNNFKAIGLDAKAATEIMLGFTDAGVSDVDFAADATREMGLIMRAGAEETGEVLKGMGLNSEEIFSGFQAGGDQAVAAYKKVITSLGNVSDGEKANVMTALFGSQSEDFYGAFDAVFEKGGMAVKSLGDISQTAENVDKNFGTTNATIQSFIRDGLQWMTTQATEHVLPVLQNLISFFKTDLQPALTPIMEVIKGIVGVLIDWKDILIPLGIFIGTFVGIIKTIAMVKTIWATATAAVTAAQVALNIAMAANPIGLIIIAVIALAAAFIYAWNHIDGFKAGWIGFWDTIGIIIGGFVNWLTEGVGPAIGAFFVGFWNHIVNTGNMVSGFFQDTLTNWQAFLGTIWKGMEDVGHNISAFFVSMWDGMTDGFTSAVDFVQDSFNNIINFFRDTGKSIGDVFMNIGQNLQNIFTVVVDSIKGSVNSIISAINAPIKAINKMRITVPGWVPSIGGKSWAPKLPTIPAFATGGTVNGPTLSLLGEGGRPETVVDTGLHNRRMAELESLKKADTKEEGKKIENHYSFANTAFSAKEAADELFRLQKWDS